MRIANQAIALDPKDEETYYNRAYAFDAQKDYAHAVADFGQAIALKPTYADAFKQENESGSIGDPLQVNPCGDATGPSRRSRNVCGR